MGLPASSTPCTAKTFSSVMLSACLTSLHVIRRVQRISAKGDTFMNTRLVAISVGCAFLSFGCSTPQERAQIAAREAAAQRAVEQEIVTAQRYRCLQYGFKDGTDSFAQCVQSERAAYDERARQKRAATAAYAQRLQQQINERKQARQNEQDEQFRTLRNSRPIQTNCTTVGFQTMCTSQ